jgi:hypothetical protein
MCVCVCFFRSSATPAGRCVFFWAFPPHVHLKHPVYPHHHHRTCPHRPLEKNPPAPLGVTLTHALPCISSTLNFTCCCCCCCCRCCYCGGCRWRCLCSPRQWMPHPCRPSWMRSRQRLSGACPGTCLAVWPSCQGRGFFIARRCRKRIRNSCVSMGLRLDWYRRLQGQVEAMPSRVDAAVATACIAVADDWSRRLQVCGKGVQCRRWVHGNGVRCKR